MHMHYQLSPLPLLGRCCPVIRPQATLLCTLSWLFAVQPLAVFELRTSFRIMNGDVRATRHAKVRRLRHLTNNTKLLVTRPIQVRVVLVERHELGVCLVRSRGGGKLRAHTYDRGSWLCWVRAPELGHIAGVLHHSITFFFPALVPTQLNS